MILPRGDGFLFSRDAHDGRSGEFFIAGNADAAPVFKPMRSARCGVDPQPATREKHRPPASRRATSVLRALVLMGGCCVLGESYAATADLSRGAVAHGVFSQRDPAVRIGLPDDVHYVGTDRFVLEQPELGPFDACVLYAFASADERGDLETFYWVQFEQYLPGHPQLHHTYDSPRHATIGGLDFYVDVEMSDGTKKPPAGSDSEHFYNLLTAPGYRRVPMMLVRFVHLPDREMRKELMIIVGERLPAGLGVAALGKGGSDEARWPAIEREFVARSAGSISIAPFLAAAGR